MVEDEKLKISGNNWIYNSVLKLNLNVYVAVKN